MYYIDTLFCLPLNRFPNVLFRIFLCKTFVVIGHVNGGMFKFVLFFVNLSNLTSAKLHQFTLP